MANLGVMDIKRHWMTVSIAIAIIFEPTHNAMLPSGADSVGDLSTMTTAASGKEAASNRRTPTPSAPKASDPKLSDPKSSDPKSSDDVIESGPLDESRAIPVQEWIVHFSEELNVPSTESGLLAEVSVETGDVIQWGDPIARLDDRKLRIQSKAASLRLDSAMQQSTDDLELQYAEKAFEEAQVELESSRAIYNDAAGAIPLTTLRRLRLSVERAVLEVARAKKAASLAKIEVDLRAADVSVIDDTLRRCQLQSPLSGVVLQVYRQRGEWVTTGESLVRGIAFKQR